MAEPLVAAEEIELRSRSGSTVDPALPVEPVPTGPFTLNRVLHALAFVTSLAAFVQAQIELAGVEVHWNVVRYYDTRSELMFNPIDTSLVDWRLAAVTLPTAVHHLFMATRPDVWWVTYCTERFSLWRWVEYSITSTAMTMRIALLSGVNDINALTGLMAMSVCMIVMGGAHEWLTALSGKLEYGLPEVLLVFSGALFIQQWAMILTTFRNVANSSPDMPSWVVAAVAGLAVFDSGFPIVALLSSYRRCAYARIDAAYAGLSLSVKVFFMQMLLYGYRSYQRDP